MLNPHRSRALCALVTAAALVALTGCGGSDKKAGSGGTTATTGTSSVAAKYNGGFVQAASSFKTAEQTAAAQLNTAKDLPTKLKALGALETAVSNAADAFSKLTPPASLKAEHAQLVAGFRQFATDLHSLKQAGTLQDKVATQAAANAIKVDEQKLNTTLTNIGKKASGG
jgi:hypothetical protein